MKSTFRRLLEIRSDLRKLKGSSLASVFEEYEKLKRVDDGSVATKVLKREVLSLLQRRLFEEMVSGSDEADLVVRRAIEIRFISREKLSDLARLCSSLEQLLKFSQRLLSVRGLDGLSESFLREKISDEVLRLLLKEDVLSQAAREPSTFLQLIDILGSEASSAVFSFLIELRSFSVREADQILKAASDRLFSKGRRIGLRFSLSSDRFFSFLGLSESEKRVFPPHMIKVRVDSFSDLEKFSPSSFPEEEKLLSEAFGPSLFKAFRHEKILLVSMALFRRGISLKNVVFGDFEFSALSLCTAHLTKERAAAFTVPWLLFGSPSEKKEVSNVLRDGFFSLETETARALSGVGTDFQRLSSLLLEKTDPKTFLDFSQKVQKRLKVSLIDHLSPEKRIMLFRRGRKRTKAF